eukprot:m.274619 g.274619  ORF g.274619 m.274619 type:complete len:370 (+) comp17690_c0_seq4:3626-4735(+)
MAMAAVMDALQDGRRLRLPSSAPVQLATLVDQCFLPSTTRPSINTILNKAFEMRMHFARSCQVLGPNEDPNLVMDMSTNRSMLQDADNSMPYVLEGITEHTYACDLPDEIQLLQEAWDNYRDSDLYQAVFEPSLYALRKYKVLKREPLLSRWRVQRSNQPPSGAASSNHPAPVVGSSPSRPSAPSTGAFKSALPHARDSSLTPAIHPTVTQSPPLSAPLSSASLAVPTADSYLGHHGAITPGQAQQLSAPTSVYALPQLEHLLEGMAALHIQDQDQQKLAYATLPRRNGSPRPSRAGVAMAVQHGAAARSPRPSRHFQDFDVDDVPLQTRGVALDNRLAEPIPSYRRRESKGSDLTSIITNDLTESSVV